MTRKKVEIKAPARRVAIKSSTRFEDEIAKEALDGGFDFDALKAIARKHERFSYWEAEMAAYTAEVES